jgi:N-formylglutamate amidohydrolase
MKDAVGMAWNFIRGTGPLVISAIHAGHELRPELHACSALDAATRLREEDPYTDRLTLLSPNRIVVHTSRFEVDLNRPLGKAVYLEPRDAWGLTVWRKRPSDALLHACRAKWKRFYREAAAFFDELRARYPFFVVLDVHSYCHRREGPSAAFDNPRHNPDVNIGTSNIDRDRWGPLVDGVIDDLSSYRMPHGRLDVRENVKFTGGHFSRWINDRYAGSACAIAVELKKIFMDEWTGVPDAEMLEHLVAALEGSLPGMARGLEALGVMDDPWLMSISNNAESASPEDHVDL